ncbi:hypothetical protein OH799_08560 [Nocardia sp. NBC_00881]|uniref:hypothetical protein n=1 Tax=Nocardia sp. NBC_00881 TaxID=2975995 RepID=UPI00386B1532|nr:hypothetical protein OH799_08560 [Nocardia sp. NBC_00881]
MSQPSRIDSSELLAMVSTLEHLIAKASRTVSELKAAIASAEAASNSNRSDRHAETPIPARESTARNPEPVPGQRTTSDRKAMPTPWSRKPPTTPWSKRLGAPCAPVPRVRPTTELSSTARQATTTHLAESELARRQANTAADSEILRVAREMATRHSLEVIGFETASIDVHTVREIASALDDMLAKYPIPLRGIEITERRDGTSSRPVRDRPSDAVRSEAPAVWIVLDGTALANPIPPVWSVAGETRSGARRHGPAERPVYTVIVREFARALDVAGGFRARQEAWRTLIAESLRGGGSVDHSLLDPGRALVEGFTEVMLHGERAGELAKALHGALVKMARAESADLSA